jgi:hypothetical protein
VARLAVAAIVGVVVGTALGAWMFRGSSASGPDPAGTVRAEVREENERLARSLERRIDELAVRIDQIASRSAAPLRESVPAPTTSAPTDGDPKPEDPSAELGRIEQKLEAMTNALEAHGRMAVYPSIEQLRSARKSIDRGEIARVSAAFVGDRENGLAMVRFLTFDEILQRFGPPTTINAEGNWFYERREGETLGPETLELDFVNGYVVSPHSTDE